jgi:hypothetical protein
MFETYPYISLLGLKGSGKTRLLTVAEKLCYNAIFSASISVAPLFRLVEATSATVLIDEAERLRDPNESQELRALLNSGYKRASKAYRCKPNTFEPVPFNVYSPKMIGNIKGLEETLQDRCINITMLRAADTEKSSRRLTEASHDWAGLRAKLYTFALSYFDPIRKIYEGDPELTTIPGLLGRDLELWAPLLSIAKFISSALFCQIKEAAQTYTQESASHTALDEPTQALLTALAQITQHQETSISISQIKEAMKEQMEEADDLPNSKWIGARLRTLDLIEEKIRYGRGRCYTIPHARVQDRQRRYQL